MKKPGIVPALVLLSFKEVSNRGDFNSFTRDFTLWLNYPSYL